ncbi:hypothetical protein E3U23_12170 [Erythrobacter litoralis]|uniref:hypothetical protein n=1 Tax=Erythrobacter litoralis TaxID=39960 RepID=UPI0024354856|nr:hypothetical protein [Erythrobacter litoralis]MDG6079945.1 hypothetical protein [Erythrobacter litoralis]
MFDRTSIAKARKDPAFEEHAWLTFYLAGEPNQHFAMKPGLELMKAFNLDEPYDGFVYAKVGVLVDEKHIERCVAKVKKLARNAGVQLVGIDLDSSPDEQSTFYTISN